MTEPVEFPSEGAVLRGLVFRPDVGTPPPVVIMAHGTSATIRMVADDYAEVFRRNGLAVPLYDHRNLGSSDGEPRLMMVAPEDEMTHADYEVACLAYRLMPPPKQWHDIAGGHFGLLYHPSPLFDEAARVQAGFLTRWLAGEQRT